MSRARRPISSKGILQCSRCGEYKHISEFYCDTKGVWFIQDMPDGSSELYGKPNSWCRECQKEYQTGKNTSARLLRQKEKFDQDLADQIAIEEAYEKGYVIWRNPELPTGWEGMTIEEYNRTHNED